MTSLGDASTDAQKRAEYSREIWTGGIALLFLVPLLTGAILHPALQPYEPFLGLSISVIILILGWRLIIVTYRDAEIARKRISLTAGKPTESLGSQLGFAAIAAVIVGGILAIAFSPQLGGFTATAAAVSIFGLGEIIRPLLKKIWEPFLQRFAHFEQSQQDRKTAEEREREGDGD
jgi:hypothetical protein